MDYNKIRNSKNQRNDNRLKILIIILAAAILTVLAASGIIFAAKYVKDMRAEQKEDIPVITPRPSGMAREYAPEASAVPVQTPEATAAPVITPAPVISRLGTAQPIPEDIRQQMAGVSMPAGATISYDELSYLTIPHYDFNGNVTEGHMVVNASVADEVLGIFAELYDIKYPIERMELVDNYGGSDYDSIDHNNTSAFNYRESTDGSGNLSKHALGLAIDINPQINPYVSGDGTGSHPNAEEYWSRDTSTWSSEIAKAAYIGPGTPIYEIFHNEHGWEWGGSWSSYRDYQHFQKVW